MIEIVDLNFQCFARFRKARRLAMDRVFSDSPFEAENSAAKVTSPPLRYSRPASARQSPNTSRNASPIREELEDSQEDVDDDVKEMISV